VIVTAVDTPAAIDVAIDGVQDLLTSGLIVCSDVEIVKYTRVHAVAVGAEGVGQSEWGRWCDAASLT
jgi:hypothetical protein